MEGAAVDSSHAFVLLTQQVLFLITNSHLALLQHPLSRSVFIGINLDLSNYVYRIKTCRVVDWR
jgi:hypothetical protein